MKLPKVESLIITVFFLCIALWAVSKCSSRRSLLTQTGRDRTGAEEEDRPQRRDTVFVQQQPAAQPVQQPIAQQPAATAPQTYAVPQPSSNGGKLPKLQNQPAAGTTPAPAAGAQPAAPAATAAAPKYSTLFVTIDGLKMRKEPSLKGVLVAKLDLYEQVYFLNKKSEKQEEISLGYEKVTDYWVKVRTKEGKEGWVFGAGVHYYKMKRKGVLE